LNFQYGRRADPIHFVPFDVDGAQVVGGVLEQSPGQGFHLPGDPVAIPDPHRIGFLRLGHTSDKEKEKTRQFDGHEGW
jgi:hypothetical protein